MQRASSMRSAVRVLARDTPLCKPILGEDCEVVVQVSVSGPPAVAMRLGGGEV